MSKPSRLFHCFSDEIVILNLAFVGGYVDAAGYIKLLGLFTSSITGNLVVACTSIFHSDGVICRFWVSFSFAFGCAVVTSLAVRLKIVMEINARVVSLVLFGLQLVVTLACLILGVIFNDTIDNAVSQNHWAIILVGSLMGFSMGIHNAAAKETIPNVPSTTVMTMTLVSISSNAANALNYYLAKHSLYSMHPRGQSAAEHKIEEKFKDSWNKFVTTLKPLISFLVGALVGASAMTHWGFWSLFVPMALNAVKMAALYMGYLADRDQCANTVAKLTALRATHDQLEVGGREADTLGGDINIGDFSTGNEKDLKLKTLSSPSVKSIAGTSCGEEEC